MLNHTSDSQVNLGVKDYTSEIQVILGVSYTSKILRILGCTIVDIFIVAKLI